MDHASSQPLVVFTVGHSNHSIETFVSLLKANRIEVLVDTRSKPYSKYAAQYNSDVLKSTLVSADIRYLFLGIELGGKPEGAEFYDQHGYVLYDKIAASPPFLKGLARVLDGAAKYRVALLCSEENPASCHRRLLIGKVLSERGVETLHIRGDGRLQSENELLRESPSSEENPQQDLFTFAPVPEWKSTQSALGKKQRNSSSNR